MGFFKIISTYNIFLSWKIKLIETKKKKLFNI